MRLSLEGNRSIGTAGNALQGQALNHPETMLFVDDTQGHARHVHAFLDQRVGADDHLNTTFGDLIEGSVAFFGRQRSGHQPRFNCKFLRVGLDAAIMLFG